MEVGEGVTENEVKICVDNVCNKSKIVSIRKKNVEDRRIGEPNSFLEIYFEKEGQMFRALIKGKAVRRFYK